MKKEILQIISDKENELLLLEHKPAHSDDDGYAHTMTIALLVEILADIKLKIAQLKINPN